MYVYFFKRITRGLLFLIQCRTSPLFWPSIISIQRLRYISWIQCPILIPTPTNQPRRWPKFPCQPQIQCCSWVSFVVLVVFLRALFFSSLVLLSALLCFFQLFPSHWLCLSYSLPTWVQRQWSGCLFTMWGRNSCQTMEYHGFSLRGGSSSFLFV